MAAILADNIFKSIFFNEKALISIKCHWGSFPRFQHSDNGLAPTRRQAIIWTNVDPIHQSIYVALGGDELLE